LHKIFTEAECCNAILFFDEADALFGKRSTVNDAHDRYANIEVSYLLQKIDEYPGIVLLASNFQQNIDEAFERRINFFIRFPLPDVVARLKLWQTVFPEQTPLAKDVPFEYLALKFDISGGNIRNIALNAAFNAIEAGQKTVNTEHIMEACKTEFIKTGRLWNSSYEYKNKE